jgi:hypothetical protein
MMAEDRVMCIIVIDIVIGSSAKHPVFATLCLHTSIIKSESRMPTMV